ESSAAPKTSFWRWSNAPFPIRTGLAPAYPESSSRKLSVRSRRPSMPYMIWSAPSSLRSRSAMNCMNSSASQSRFRKWSAWREQAVLPRQRTEALLAGTEGVAGARSVVLDPEQQVGLQPDRRAFTGRVRAVAILRQRPLPRRPPVIEGGLAHELHLDVALDAR